jgi:hypothetical protein
MRTSKSVARKVTAAAEVRNAPGSEQIGQQSGWNLKRHVESGRSASFRPPDALCVSAHRQADHTPIRLPGPRTHDTPTAQWAAPRTPARRAMSRFSKTGPPYSLEDVTFLAPPHDQPPPGNARRPASPSSAGRHGSSSRRPSSCQHAMVAGNASRHGG